MSDAIYLQWQKRQEKLLEEQAKINQELEPLKRQIESWKKEAGKIQRLIDFLGNPPALENGLGYFSNTKINEVIWNVYRQAKEDVLGDIVFLLRGAVINPINDFHDKLSGDMQLWKENGGNADDLILVKIKEQIANLGDTKFFFDGVIASVPDNWRNFPMLNILHDPGMRMIIENEMEHLETLQKAISYAQSPQSNFEEIIRDEKLEMDELQKKIQREGIKVSELEAVLEPIESELYITEESFYVNYMAGKKALLPTRFTGKKWCFNLRGTPVYKEPDGVEGIFKIAQGGIVEPRKKEQDANNISWVLVDHVSREYDKKENKWISTDITGWVNDIYLEDYIEVFSTEEVEIPHKTDDPFDAQQYMYLDADFDGKLDPTVKYNMCGELSVAYIVKNEIDPNSNIEKVVINWKEHGSRYGAGTIKNGTGVADLKDMLGTYDRYKNSEDENLMVDLRAGLKDGKLSFDGMKDMIKTHYLIVLITVDHWGGLISNMYDKTLHWVVLEKITNNGRRVELYNPFPNKLEEYSFTEFVASCRPTLPGVWVKRNNEIKVDWDDSPSKKVAMVPLDDIDSKDRSEDYQASRAEQYIKREGGQKNNLCGEFSVTYVVGQSIENAVRHWKENPPSELWEIISILKAYGWQREISKDKKTNVFTIGTVLDLWEKTQPQLYNYHVGNDKGTGGRELRTILKSYGYNTDGDFTDFRSGLTVLEKGEKLYLPSPGRMAEMLKTHFLIAGVGIEGQFGRLKVKGSIRHWVVVEKITPTGRHYVDQHFGGNGGWVELYNPFMNRLEEYSYREFTDSMSETGLWDGLWVKRDVKPVFIKSQDPLPPQAEESKGKKNNNKNNKAREMWSEKVLREEIEKRIKNGNDVKKIPQLLFRASGWSKDAITKLLPRADVDIKSMADFDLTLVRERLGSNDVEIPSDVEAFFARRSSLAADLASALHEFGALSVDDNKVGIPDVNSTTINLQAGRTVKDESAASQLTAEVVKVIAPILVSRTMEEIKAIRAKQIEEDKKMKASSTTTTTIMASSRPKLFRVRKWGDEVLIDLDGASTKLHKTSNFQAVRLVGKDARGQADFNDMAKVQTVDYEYLRSLQYEQKGHAGSVKKIMNWLVRHDGWGVRPYWGNAQTLHFGTIVFGGQLVEVESVGDVPVEYRFDAKYPNRDRLEKDQLFYKLQGLRKSEMGRVSHKTHPYKIQHGTEALRKPKENTYKELPRSTEIFHPVWDSRDWPCNLHGGTLYIAAAYLEKDS